MSASIARILVRLDASKLSSLAALMRGESFLGELVELARSNIPLNLEVPGIRVIMPEPVPESLQAGPVKLLDFALQQLNLGHPLSLARVILDNKDPGRAASDRSPPATPQLGEGSLEGNVVTCPLHGWQYDVTSGACTNNPAAKVACYQAKLEGDDVLVALG